MAEIYQFIGRESVNINKKILLNTFDCFNYFFFIYSYQHFNHSYLDVIQYMLFISFYLCMLCLCMYSMSETTAIPSHLESPTRPPYRGLRRQWLLLQSYYNFQEFSLRSIIFFFIPRLVRFIYRTNIISLFTLIIHLMHSMVNMK